MNKGMEIIVVFIINEPLYMQSDYETVKSSINIP